MGWFFKSNKKKERDFWDWFHENEILNKLKPVRGIAADFDSLFEKKSEKKYLLF